MEQWEKLAWSDESGFYYIMWMAAYGCIAHLRKKWQLDVLCEDEKSERQCNALGSILLGKLEFWH